MNDKRGDIYNGLRIPLIQKGKKSPSFLSAKYGQTVVKAINAFLNIKIERGGQNDEIYISDANVVLKLKDSETTSSPSSDSSGTAGIYKAKFVNNHDDYIVVKVWDEVASDWAESTTYVAKPYKLREVSAASIDGYDLTYDSYNYDSQRRTAHIATLGYSEIQVISPRYLVDDVLYFANGVNTGLVIGGTTSVTRLDINVDARAWLFDFSTA